MAQPVLKFGVDSGDMNATQLLDRNALLCVTANGFAVGPHLCEMWVREVVQATFGPLFDRFWCGTALLTAQAFAQTSHLCVALAVGSQPGDLLYKTHGSGGDGHVGIRITGNRVAENSSVHWNGRDARGIRSLTEFGNFDVIVRLALDPRLIHRAPIDQPG